MMVSLISFLGAACTVLAVTPWIGRMARARGLVDLPGVRKVHRIPTPRVGGIAIVLGAIVGMLFAALIARARGSHLAFDRPFIALVTATMLVFLVGFADDLKNISSKFKLIVVLGAAIACQLSGIRIEVLDLFGWHVRLGWLASPVTLLWTVGITVAVNFIDGLDGLAAGICAAAAGAVAIVAAGAGNIALCAASLALLGSLLGFLFFNFNPASIFMGDCGSLCLGFFLATSAIAATAPGAAVRLMLPAAVLGVPIFDTAFTMIRRGVLQRRSLFSAERGHLHHRLVDRGIKHRDAVLVLYGVTLLAGIMGLVIHFSSHASIRIVVACALVALLLKVFSHAGAVKLGETLKAIRRNRTRGQAASSDRHRFEEMQLRLKAAVGFESWWHEVCLTANSLNFARVELPLICRDGSHRNLVWTRDGFVELLAPSSQTSAIRKPESPDHHGHEQGNGNGHGKANGNGNGRAIGNGDDKLFTHMFSDIDVPHHDRSPLESKHLNDVLRGDVPIRQRRSGQPLRASVAVCCDGSLESAGRRLALFVRLMEEHSVADIVDKASAHAASELTKEPGSAHSQPSIFAEQSEALGIPRALPSNVRIAVVHDFLYCYGGAERVLEQILKVLPSADVFSLFDFLPDGQRGFLRGKTVQTSFIQKLPWARRKHRSYLPLMPLAIEQLDVSNYDVVVSSSYVAAKGVITRPDQLHICYCHTPIRFAWDLQHQYLAQAGLTGGGIKSMLARLVLHYIRSWDARSSNGVDTYITNSNFVARRIQKFYRRKSRTIYPPVAVDKFSMCEEKHEFYMTASRLVPYKRVDLIVEAFSKMPSRRLIVVGEGPDFDKIKAKAGPNVKIVGHQSFERLRKYMQMASAFVFAAEEDFGIVPVEAQACGTPVIAFGRGGVTESVIAGETGVFFDEQTPESLIAAVEKFEALRDAGRWDADQIRKHAEQFSAERFRQQISALLSSEWAAFGERRRRQDDGIGDTNRKARKLRRRERRLGPLGPSTEANPVLDESESIGAA